MDLETLEAAWADDVEEILRAPLDWEAFAGKRIVVTGINGFLGGYVARTLLSLNRTGRLSKPLTLIAITRSAIRSRERLKHWIDDDIELIEWDLSTIAIPEFAEVDSVIHAASQASPVFYSSDPVGTLLPNSVGTPALLEAMRRSRNQGTFFYVSSSEVYGAVSSEGGLAETGYGVSDPASLRACYSESKRMGETTCIAYAHQYGIRTFIARPFHIRPRSRPR